MIRAIPETVLPPFEGRTAAAASLGVGGFAALFGLGHALATTQGSALGYVLVVLLYLSLAGVPVYLLLRYALVTPALVVALFALRTATFDPAQPSPDGLYPGLVLVWPVLLGLVGVLAGLEVLARRLLSRGTRPSSQ